MKRLAIRVASVLRAIADRLDSEVMAQTSELFWRAFDRSCNGGWVAKMSLNDARYAWPIDRNLKGARRRHGDTCLMDLTVSQVWGLLRDDRLKVFGLGKVGRRQMMEQWNLIVGGED